MKYHALFATLKKQQNLKLRLLQITGGALRVNPAAQFIIILIWIHRVDQNNMAPECR